MSNQLFGMFSPNLKDILDLLSGALLEVNSGGVPCVYCRDQRLFASTRLKVVESKTQKLVRRNR